MLKKEGRHPQLPDASFGYLVDYLFEVGPVLYTAQGAQPLTHKELLAWQLNMRRMLLPWEIVFLRRLSLEYWEMLSEAEDPTFPAPYSERPGDEDLKRVTRNLHAFLSGMSDK